MTYQPPVPLLVPSSMPAVPPDVVGLDLPNLGLMTPEEELSNQQLDHSVGRWPRMAQSLSCHCKRARLAAMRIC